MMRKIYLDDTHRLAPRKRASSAARLGLCAAGICAGMLLGCRTTPRGAPAIDSAAVDQAPQSAALPALRAIGQEPGWMLDLVPGTEMRFTYDYGAKTVVTPVPQPEQTNAGRRWHAVTETHDLLVVVSDSACADVMSGAPYPMTVTVTLDGQVFRGCGGPRSEADRGGPRATSPKSDP